MQELSLLRAGVMRLQYLRGLGHQPAKVIHFHAGRLAQKDVLIVHPDHPRVKACKITKYLVCRRSGG